ncbi:MAG TPA: hypothetical protein VMR96_09485 [Solirubrobacterales bacterium]|nr:hypothetical protein [Solirubrobacterales bacterium]
MDPKILNEPRWLQEQAAGRGCYEAYFVVASDAKAGVGVWLRWAFDVKLDGSVEPSVWGAFFDRADPSRTFSLRAVHGAAAIGRAGEAGVLAIGEAKLTDAGCEGEVEGGGHSLRWRLSFADQGSATDDAAQLVTPGFLRPIAALKRSGYYIPRPHLRVSGALEVDGRPVELRDAPGCQAHLHGATRYPAWAWAHCSSFDETRDASLDLLSIEGPGGIWFPLFSFRYQGRLHRFAELPWIARSTSSRASPSWHVTAEDATLAIDGVIHAPVEQMVEVEYVNPDGRRQFCVNTELAHVELKVRTRSFPGAQWRPEGTLRCVGGAGLEFCGPAADSRVGNKMQTAFAAASNGSGAEVRAATSR